MYSKIKSIFVILITISLVGCENSSKQDLSTLARVAETKQITIGTGTTVPPMNYLNSKGEWAGFDIDFSQALVEEISKLLKVELSIKRVPVNNKTRVSFLNNGRIDMTVSSMSRTESRDDIIDFVDPPYFYSTKVFYSRKGENLSIADLGGKKIAVVQGSNAYTAVTEEILKHSNIEPQIISFQTNAECFLALRQKKVDAYSQDLPIIIGVSSKYAEQFEVVGTGYSPGLYSIGVIENDSEWRDIVGVALQRMFRNGEYEKVYSKWFGASGIYPLPVDARPRLPDNLLGKSLYIIPR